jgi:hypothetical protein
MQEVRGSIPLGSTKPSVGLYVIVIYSTFWMANCPTNIFTTHATNTRLLAWNHVSVIADYMAIMHELPAIGCGVCHWNLMADSYWGTPKNDDLLAA